MLGSGSVRCTMQPGRRHDIAFDQTYRPHHLSVDMRVIGQAPLAGLFDDVAVILAR